MRLGTALLLLIAASGCGNGSLPAEALGLAGLAALPASATNVRSDGTKNTFSATYVIQFKAPAADIDAFLKASPRLAGITPEALTDQHQYIPYAEAKGETSKLESHATFHPEARFPWYVPAVRSKGRRFVIPQDRQAVYGEVVVDDAAAIVYIKVSRS